MLKASDAEAGRNIRSAYALAVLHVGTAQCCFCSRIYPSVDKCMRHEKKCSVGNVRDVKFRFPKRVSDTGFRKSIGQWCFWCP